MKEFLMLYIDLRPGQICHSKDGRSCIFRWRRRAWLTIWDRVKIPRYSHKLMHQKRVNCELHDSYFHSMMFKTCHSKDGGSCIFCRPFMGRDWVGVELLYSSVHRKFNQSWRNDAIEKASTQQSGPSGPRLSNCREDAGMRNMSQRGWAPRPPVEQPRRTGKKRWWP